MSSLTAKKVAVRLLKNTFLSSKKAPGCPQKAPGCPQKRSRTPSKKITDALRKAPGHTYGYEHGSQTHMIKNTSASPPEG